MNKKLLGALFSLSLIANAYAAEVNYRQIAQEIKAVLNTDSELGQQINAILEQVEVDSSALTEEEQEALLQLHSLIMQEQALLEDAQ